MSGDSGAHNPFHALAKLAGEVSMGLHTLFVGQFGDVADSGSVARKYFTMEEFLALHPGNQQSVYHSAQHSENVARVTGELAGKFDPANKEFLQQVALIHDIDPARPPGTPARVPATLEWIERSRQDLMKRFNWSENDVSRAKALIIRTEFPFDDELKTNSYNGAYAERSPLQTYRDAIANLPEADRAAVIRGGAILSEYADKGSFYLQSFDTAKKAVEGLVNELGNVGVKTTREGLHTARFLDEIGTPESFELDRRVAAEFHLEDLNLPLRDDVFRKLKPAEVKNFTRNLEKFKAIDSAPSPEDRELS